MADQHINGQPWKQQYAFNTSQSGDITGWADYAGNLPTEDHNRGALVVTKDRVIWIGGENPFTETTTVESAPINADGTVGIYSTDTSLPVALTLLEAVYTKNRVYIFGGESSNVGYTSPVDANGRTGSWTSITVPGMTSLAYAQPFVTTDKLYLVNGSGEGTTYYTTINADGTINDTSWTAGTSLPVLLSWQGIAVTNDKVYTIGGWVSGSRTIATLYTATIGEDGIVGAWSTYANALPEAKHYPLVVVTNNTVYALGGVLDDGITTQKLTVFYASIDASGNIGVFSTGTPMNRTIQYARIFATENFLHICIESNSRYITAAFSGGLNDYSEKVIYIEQVEPANINGTIDYGGTWTLDVPEGLNFTGIIDYSGEITVLSYPISVVGTIDYAGTLAVNHQGSATTSGVVVYAGSIDASSSKPVTVLGVVNYDGSISMQKPGVKLIGTIVYDGDIDMERNYFITMSGVINYNGEAYAKNPRTSGLPSHNSSRWS